MSLCPMFSFIVNRMSTHDRPNRIDSVIARQANTGKDCRGCLELFLIRDWSNHSDHSVKLQGSREDSVSVFCRLL